MERGGPEISARESSTRRRWDEDEPIATLVGRDAVGDPQGDQRFTRCANDACTSPPSDIANASGSPSRSPMRFTVATSTGSRLTLHLLVGSSPIQRNPPRDVRARTDAVDLARRRPSQGPLSVPSSPTSSGLVLPRLEKARREASAENEHETRHPKRPRATADDDIDAWAAPSLRVSVRGRPSGTTGGASRSILWDDGRFPRGDGGADLPSRSRVD